MESYSHAPPVGPKISIIKSQSTDNGDSWAQKGQPAYKTVATLEWSVARDEADPSSRALNASQFDIGGPFTGLDLSTGEFLMFCVALTHRTFGGMHVGSREWSGFGPGATEPGMPSVGYNLVVRSTDGARSAAH